MRAYFRRAGRLVLWVTAIVVTLIGSDRLNAQSDLDLLMREVLESRDGNWTRLQQYVLDEREQATVRGPSGAALWGERRDYTWYIRDSIFVRSPLRVNGAAVRDEDRHRYEQQFIRRELERERRRRGETTEGTASASDNATEPADAAGDDVAALMRQGRQPQFISSAYFLRFRFESGRYALVGRETLEGRTTLKVEYYPDALFREPRRPSARARADDPVGRETRRLLNKVSLVTLWIEPTARQILKYSFNNVSLDFLPTQWLARVTDVNATMTMGQPFPDVWLPGRIDATVAGTIASGQWELQYRTEYLDYRRADVGSKVIVPDAAGAGR
jgi:hypothetical protein